MKAIKTANRQTQKWADGVNAILLAGAHNVDAACLRGALNAVYEDIKSTRRGCPRFNALRARWTNRDDPCSTAQDAAKLHAWIASAIN